MPTNLLVWNVQFFTSNKISMQKSEWLDLVDINGNVVDGNFDTLLNLEYITTNIKDADAHIFVLIENLSSQGTMGSLAEGNGAIGSRLMLDRIRGATLNANWMLVPPLKLVDKVQTEKDALGLLALLKEGAYTECISVYYRSDLLNFVGPYVWPLSPNNNDTRKVAQRNTGQATQAYPADWDDCYPVGNSFAGQFEFFVNPVARTGQVLFPDYGSRRPFLTQFREIGGAARLITLVSVHYPPNSPDAGTAFARTLSYFAQGNWPIQPDEVILVAGDFNLDYLTDGILDSDRLDGTARRNGFSLALRTPWSNQPTMLKNKRYATPYSYLKQEGLDNIAYRYGGGILPVIVDVLDRVGGTLPSLMFTSMASIKALPTEEQKKYVFRLEQNFSYMGPVPGVSDHLALQFQF